MDRLSGGVNGGDEVHGFRYFEDATCRFRGRGGKSRRAGRRGRPGRARGPAVHRRQLRHRPEVPARHAGMERPAVGAGEGARPHQAGQHPAAHRGGRPTPMWRRPAPPGPAAPSGRSCGTKCHSAAPGAASSAPISLATPPAPASPSRCWPTCSSAAARQLRPDTRFLRRGQRRAVLRAIGRFLRPRPARPACPPGSRLSRATAVPEPDLAD